MPRTLCQQKIMSYAIRIHDNRPKVNRIVPMVALRIECGRKGTQIIHKLHDWPAAKCSHCHAMPYVCADIVSFADCFVQVFFVRIFLPRNPNHMSLRRLTTMNVLFVASFIRNGIRTLETIRGRKHVCAVGFHKSIRHKILFDFRRFD